jgi:hypothetical protein
LAQRSFEKLDGYGLRILCTEQPMAAEENLSSTVIYCDFDNALPNYRLAGVRFDPLARIGAGR